MIEAARPVFAENALLPGYEVRAIVVPSLARPGGVEPARFSVFDEGGAHKVTVTRSATGEYTPSASRVDERVPRGNSAENDQAQDNSLYASLFYTAVKQGVPSDLIMQILRIHAYETDFRQRVRAGDGLEFFFDMKGEDKGIDGSSANCWQPPSRFGGAKATSSTGSTRGTACRLLRRGGEHVAQVPHAPAGTRRGRAPHVGFRRGAVTRCC